MDLREKIYSAFEKLAELDSENASQYEETKGKIKPWLQDMAQNETDAKAAKSKIEEELKTIKAELDTTKTELETAQSQIGKGDDERVSTLEETLKKERKAHEESLASLKSDFLKSEVRRAYSEGLTIDKEVKDMLLDNLMSTTEFTEKDGIYYHVAKDGTSVPHGDHIKSLQDKYSKYSETRAGGDTTPQPTSTDGGGGSQSLAFVEEAKAQLQNSGALPMMSGQ